MMRFSPLPGYTTGADDLVGCLGLVSTGSWAAPASSLNGLTDKAKRIVLHYRTEPKAVNFVSVTSFMNPYRDTTLEGGVLGLDILGPDKPRQPTFSVNGVPVYDCNDAATMTRRYLERFPMYPGSRVYEANAEVFGDRPGTVYSTLAIGVPDKDGYRLLMEDAAYLKELTRDDVLERAARSILACGELENRTYRQVYVASNFQDVGDGELGWSQVQFMYVLPPRDIVPLWLVKSFDDLRGMSFNEWCNPPLREWYATMNRGDAE